MKRPTVHPDFSFLRNGKSVFLVFTEVKPLDPPIRFNTDARELISAVCLEVAFQRHLARKPLGSIETMDRRVFARHYGV